MEMSETKWNTGDTVRINEKARTFENPLKSQYVGAVGKVLTVFAPDCTYRYEVQFMDEKLQQRNRSEGTWLFATDELDVERI
jgi:hypothetical protein